jgi:transcriptional regulator with XRE-family HTH domain
LGNEHLRTAITRSGLTLEEFADIVGVDVKTVQRWLAGRVPYAGNRARVAGALDTTERALWPDAVPVPTTTEAHKLTTAVTDDAIAGYGHATDPAAPDGATLLRAAVERIEIAIPSLASQPDLVELLRISDANGRQSRILIEDPDEQVEALLGLDGVEIRASPAGEDHILYRADDEMLLVLTPIGSASASPPIIHLRRQTDGGLFDRLAADFDDRWLEATPLTSREQVHAYLADTELEPRPEPEHSPAADPQPVRAPARPPDAPTASAAEAPRRWPRRPT